MSARHQHAGLVVADIERAVAFYRGVFDAHPTVQPIVMDAAEISRLMEGPPGTAVELAMLELDGGAIELFCFLGTAIPDWVRPNTSLIPHLCIQVDDVPATLARAESLGGKRIWEEIRQDGGVQLIYIRDPDGNAIELINVSSSQLAETLHGRGPK